jgi:hypothetical protein
LFCYYRGERLFAARLGDWKIHFITQGSYGDPKAVTHEQPLLFNLARDPAEALEVSAQYPDVVRRLTEAVAEHRKGVLPVRSQLIDVVTK